MLTRYKKRLFLFCCVFLLSWTSMFFAYAADTGNKNNSDNSQNWFSKVKSSASSMDWQSMLNNFAKSFPNIEQLIAGTAYLFGIVFAVRALYYLKVYGELRTMMSSNSSLRVPMTYLLVAMAFLYWPTMMDTLMQTVFHTPEVEPLSYISETQTTSYGLGLRSVLAFIQLIGYIAFVRGWLIISHTAQQGGGRETIGKGLTHIFGGILAINIVGTRDVIWNTLGLQ